MAPGMRGAADVGGAVPARASVIDRSRRRSYSCLKHREADL